MKRIAFASLLLMISLCAGVTAQTSPSSTPENASPAATEFTVDQTVAKLIAEVKDLRELRLELSAERDALQATLNTELENSGSLERSYAAANNQIATLNRVIDHLEKTIALNETTINLVEAQRDDAKREAKRARKKAILSGAASIILSAIIFLR